jgi:hypothetical protein
LLYYLYLVEVLKGIRNNNILLLRCNCSKKKENKNLSKEQ